MDDSMIIYQKGVKIENFLAVSIAYSLKERKEIKNNLKRLFQNIHEFESGLRLINFNTYISSRNDLEEGFKHALNCLLEKQKLLVSDYNYFWRRVEVANESEDFFEIYKALKAKVR